ncbi:formate hydrogenlyase maturation HycH family protein [Pantoea sp. B65]|uniref:formate hydrogenlyase maturation HycH family protein n=1 Tax=Pantoea sp. B65 TaxID=2813359 RepID=UPI0039B543D8
MNDQRYARHQPHAGDRYFGSGKVVFYALHSKFVDEKSVQAQTSPKAREVVYYSLAIGHHLGVIDCLKAQLVCPQADYQQWLETLPLNSEARRKLAGVQQFGEINIDNSHTHLLACALSKAMPVMNEQQQGWSQQLIALLQQIENEPAVYLLVRKYDA